MSIQKVNGKNKHFDKHLAESQNRNKCAWNIMKELTRKGTKNDFINFIHRRKNYAHFSHY